MAENPSKPAHSARLHTGKLRLLMPPAGCHFHLPAFIDHWSLTIANRTDAVGILDVAIQIRGIGV